MWDNPTELLFYVLKAKPELTFHEFKRLLDSLFTNLRAYDDPTAVHTLATELWMGKKNWRKFAKDLLTLHLNQSLDDVPSAWETQGNP
jgi:hypothetical protein